MVSDMKQDIANTARNFFTYLRSLSISINPDRDKSGEDGQTLGPGSACMVALVEDESDSLG